MRKTRKWAITALGFMAALSTTVVSATNAAADLERGDQRAPAQLSVLVDGTRHAAADLAPDVKYFLLTADSQTNGYVLGFRDEATYENETARATQAAVARQSVSTAGADNNRVYFYEAIHYDTSNGNEVFDIGNHESIPDLTVRGKDCFLWWCSTNWNNVISSLHTGFHNVRLSDGTGFGAPSVTFAPFVNVPDLRAIPAHGGGNWNDRASSVTVGV